MKDPIKGVETARVKTFFQDGPGTRFLQKRENEKQ